MKQYVIAAALVGLAASTALALNGLQKAPAALSVVNDGKAATRPIFPITDRVSDINGNIHVPSDYRQTYEFLGSWGVAADDGKGVKQMHIVYASPGTAATFQKSGHFPDGTVLVKEVYDTAIEPMTTGSVNHEKKLNGWFVMIRDSKNTHPGNKLWGDGWGWSWFDADNPIKTTSTDYKADCQGCHVPARSTDWIYTYGYPPLKK